MAGEDPLAGRSARRHGARARAVGVAASLALSVLIALAPAAQAQEAAQDPALLADEIERVVAQLVGAPGSGGELALALEQLQPWIFGRGAPEPRLVIAFGKGARALALAPGLAAPDAGWLEKARRATERFEDPAARADARAFLELRLFEFHLQKDESGAARAALADALQTAAAGSQRFGARILVRLAELERQGGDLGQALDHLEQAEARLDETVPGDVRFELFLILAQVYADLGVLDGAARCIDDIRALGLAPSTPELRFAFLLLSTNIDLATKKQELVVAELEELLFDDSFFADHPVYRSRLEISLGAALAELESEDGAREPKAERTLLKALSDPELPPDERRIAHTLLVNLLMLAGRTAEAREHLAEASALLESTRTGTESGRFAREAFVLAAYSARLTQGAEEEALTAALAKLRTSYREFLEQARTAPFRPGGVGSLHFSNVRFALLELMQLEIERGGNAAAVEAFMQAESLGTLARSLEARAGSLAEIRGLLASGHGVLAYLPGPDRSLVFAFDREHFVSEPLPAKFELERACADFSSLFAMSPGSSSAESRARGERELAAARTHVAELLLPTAVRELVSGWTAVTIVGADLLGGIPFECLPLGDKFLGLDWALDYLPSLTIGLYLGKQTQTVASSAGERPELWLVAAPSAPAGSKLGWPGLKAIPFDASDLARLTAPYPRDAVRSFLGPSATIACLQHPEMHGALVLHVIAHGAFEAREERPPLLVLAPGPHDSGLLRCSDVERLRVPPLVILSACGAARGQKRLGDDGLAHLGGAFFGAGARCVISSRSELELAATQALMAAFHEHLRAGDSPAEAMRKARRVVAGKKGWSHPFYYSLLQVVGLGHEPLFATSR